MRTITYEETFPQDNNCPVCHTEMLWRKMPGGCHDLWCEKCCILIYIGDSNISRQDLRRYHIIRGLDGDIRDPNSQYKTTIGVVDKDITLGEVYGILPYDITDQEIEEILASDENVYDPPTEPDDDGFSTY